MNTVTRIFLPVIMAAMMVTNTVAPMAGGGGGSHMAETSLPQAGNAVGDAGPYTSDEWADFFEVTFTGDQYATQGVLLNYLQELQITSGGALAVRVAPGAGFCYGHFYHNSAYFNININVAGAGGRTDRVVMLQNNTNANYDGSTDYGAICVTPVVPRNSTRVAVLYGVEPNPMRPLMTGPNAYMVELARYSITGATMSAITDYREYCEFSHNIPDGSVVTGKLADDAVTTAKIDDDAVDDTKAGNRVPQFYRRQGGSATDWSTTGTTNYTPTAVRIQGGVATATILNGNTFVDSLLYTFPVAFSNVPLLYTSVEPSATESVLCITTSLTAGGMNFRLYRTGAAGNNPVNIHWLAIGPE